MQALTNKKYRKLYEKNSRALTFIHFITYELWIVSNKVIKLF